jgi:ketosteroid isomerase-like protein
VVSPAFDTSPSDLADAVEPSLETSDDSRVRAMIGEHWSASERGDIAAEHALYAEDAVLDYPQSGERFRGRATIAAQRGGHPADRHFAVRRISGSGDLWVSECVITYDGVPSHTVSIMELSGGLVAHETQFFADPFEAPPSRAALGERMPASPHLPE